MNMCVSHSKCSLPISPSQVIYRLWQPLPDYQLWHCGGDYTIVLLVLSILHLLAWVSIACSVFALDYLELLGIKQVRVNYHD